MPKQDYSKENADQKETAEGAVNTGAVSNEGAETPAENVTETKQEEAPASEETKSEAQA